MKYITQGHTPQELRRWFEGQPIADGRRLNCSYDDIPGNVKQAVKQRLLDEQGGLCCYTGQRVSEDSSHIEHLKPQTLCENHEDVDYANLLAAYPGVNSQGCPYGAYAKADWYDAELLISPLSRHSENRFRFDLRGRIRPASNGDPAALETITRLCLDHDSLTELRKQAIDAALFPQNRPRRRAQLRQITQSYCDRDTQNRFPHFCFVIMQAAQMLLERAERRRKRKQAIHQQARK